MESQSHPELYEMLQRMRESSIIRLTKMFFLSMTSRAEVLAQEMGVPEMKMIYFGFLANLRPEGSTSKELAERLKVSKQAISKMTQEIQQLGFIEFHPHDTDGRASVIRLTDKGIELLKIGLEISEQIKEELTQKIGKKSLDTMIDSLKTILDEKQES